MKIACNNLYSDAMDAATGAYANAGYFQRREGRSGSAGEDIVRERIAAAIDAFLEEIPQSDLARLARPPAPHGNGTTVGTQSVARSFLDGGKT